MCRVFVTGLPFMPAAATIVMGVLLGVLLYGGHLWAGTELVPLEPQRAEAHQPVVLSADVISHDSRTVQLNWTGGVVFTQVRVRFIVGGLPYSWSSPLPALGTRNFIVPGDMLSARYEMQGCEGANVNNGTCSFWHNHVASGTVTFLARPTIVNWSVSPDGTVLETDNIGFSYRATNSTRVVITRNNLDYITGLDGNGDLIVATVNPHIRNLNVDTHTFRLTAYRFVSATNEELSTESPDVFIVTVRAGVTPPTSTRTRTRTRTWTPTIVGVPVVPDLTGLNVSCSLTGSNNQTQARATWNTPSGSLPTGVSRTGYSVTWSNLDDLENPTETMMVTGTSATQRAGYGYGDLAHVRVRVVYSWTGSSQRSYLYHRANRHLHDPNPGGNAPRE